MSCYGAFTQLNWPFLLLINHSLGLPYSSLLFSDIVCSKRKMIWRVIREMFVCLLAFYQRGTQKAIWWQCPILSSDGTNYCKAGARGVSGLKQQKDAPFAKPCCKHGSLTEFASCLLTFERDNTEPQLCPRVHFRDGHKLKNELQKSSRIATVFLP